jgi:hypothetical protein
MDKPSQTVPIAMSCPSAQATSAEAEVFGVIGGNADGPRVEYLDRPVPVTPEMLQRLNGMRAGEVLRTRAPCAQTACVHHTGRQCSLGERVAALPHAGDGRLPPCAIRSTCRWFAEQGKDACLRCPSIVTEVIASATRIDSRIYLPILAK